MIPFEYENERERLFWLNTTYACGGIIVKNNKVVETAPIYKWMKNKTLVFILNYLKQKGTLIKCHEVV